MFNILMISLPYCYPLWLYWNCWWMSFFHIQLNSWFNRMLIELLNTGIPQVMTVYLVTIQNYDTTPPKKVLTTQSESYVCCSGYSTLWLTTEMVQHTPCLLLPPSCPIAFLRWYQCPCRPHLVLAKWAMLHTPSACCWVSGLNERLQGLGRKGGSSSQSVWSLFVSSGLQSWRSCFP